MNEQAGLEVMKAIGERLKRYRLERGLSLREAASAAGLSPSFVSMVERGVAEIAVSRLIRLADVYGVVVADLMDDVHEPTVEFVPAAQAHNIPHPVDGVEVSYLSSPSWTMQPFLVRLRPGASLESLTHATEEFVHCVRGTPTMVVMGQVKELRPGDTLVLPAHSEHTYMNGGSEEAVFVGAVRRPEHGAPPPTLRPRRAANKRRTSRRAT
jgi:transcriptional regulator with XRE-family HTH domain